MKPEVTVGIPTYSNWFDFVAPRTAGRQILVVGDPDARGAEAVALPRSGYYRVSVEALEAAVEQAMTVDGAAWGRRARYYWEANRRRFYRAMAKAVGEGAASHHAR